MYVNNHGRWFHSISYKVEYRKLHFCVWISSKNIWSTQFQDINIEKDAIDMLETDTAKLKQNIW